MWLEVCCGSEVQLLWEERGALINPICSGDVSLMPEMKRDQTGSHSASCVKMPQVDQ
ncbi:hypothetical protein KUCAC02_007772, partial [Chaenocephalus aceratus]